jgi:hypothetical protein
MPQLSAIAVDALPAGVYAVTYQMVLDGQIVAAVALQTQLSVGSMALAVDNTGGFSTDRRILWR